VVIRIPNVSFVKRTSGQGLRSKELLTVLNMYKGKGKVVPVLN